jgi:drug/metabolite transporter superfamily protein YnfA
MTLLVDPSKCLMVIQTLYELSGGWMVTRWLNGYKKAEWLQRGSLVAKGWMGVQGGWMVTRRLNSHTEGDLLRGGWIVIMRLHG